MKKIGVGIILILFIFINNYSYITDWNSAELIGFNLWAIFLPALGLFLVIKGILDRKKTKKS